LPKNIRDDYFNDFIDSSSNGDMNCFDEGLVDDEKFALHESPQSDGNFIPSVAPPPIPPSKIRSKMHDLAVRHRLITNQNTRGQGQLHLSSEEKRTLIQEGYSIPTKLPLTRDEEESLKIIRRKIKNKLSAQESRRKRKEYMDCLEKKAHSYYADNQCLKQRIRQLELANRDLATQLKNLQAIIDGGPRA
jgi:cyclic AMP-responsive element-binding protein 3